MTSASHFVSTIEKLDGRSNFNTWQFAVKAYLEREGLWNSVLGTETDATKNTKAKSDLILLVKPTNFVHITTCTTAKSIWDKLSITFADTGLTRRVSLIRTLSTTRLVNFSNVEEYVNTIMLAAHKLQNIHVVLDDEWIGSFMLAGLPEQYSPMLMAIESFGIAITADFAKTKLLQEIKSTEGGRFNDSMAFYSSNRNGNHVRKRNGPRCYECNEMGHMSYDCQRKNFCVKCDSKTTNGVSGVKFTSGYGNETNINSGNCSGASTGGVNKTKTSLAAGHGFSGVYLPKGQINSGKRNIDSEASVYGYETGF